MLSDFEDKKVVFLGFEKTNRALYGVLRERFPELEIAVADMNVDLELPDDENLTSVLGEAYLSGLDYFDVIIRSPGVRYWPEVLAVKNKVITATNLFFAELREKCNARIIGVTGSKGKSTVSSLIYEVFSLAGRDTFLIGNVGVPDWSVFDDIKDGSWVIYEMSSYMLEDFDGWPDIAVMISAFPDHVDWHGDYDSYMNAKANITRRQYEDDVFIFHSLFADLGVIAEHTRARVVAYKTMSGLHFDREFFYDGDEVLFPVSAVKLLGRHNLDNVLAVLAVAKVSGVPVDFVEKSVREFTGLPHRLEIILERNGVIYVDDAISTTPESSIAALESVIGGGLGGGVVGGLVLGGLDRGQDFGGLAAEIVERGVGTVFVLPGCRRRILADLAEAGFEGEVFEVESVAEAVRVGADAVKAGVFLLSSAAASTDQYVSYIEEGDEFANAVMKTR